MTIRYDDFDRPRRPLLSAAAKVGLWVGFVLFLLGLAVLDAWWSR